MSALRLWMAYHSVVFIHEVQHNIPDFVWSGNARIRRPLSGWRKRSAITGLWYSILYQGNMHAQVT